MATNYNQILMDSLERSESLSPSMSGHDLAQNRELPPVSGGAVEGNEVRSFHRQNKNNNGCFYPGKTTNNGSSLINDARLIRNRKICFNHKARRELELRCEEKTGKYKLEEVHSSIPSSIKSTFIMTFSPDGQRVASTHGDHRIYICDLNTGKLLDTLDGHPKTPWCLAWHPSNRGILASGCLAGEVRVWDLKSKACESWVNGGNTIITSLDFHPRERVLAIATANGVLFWDWSESEPFAKTTTMHEKEKVKFVEFDSTGMKLITGISNLPKYAGYSNNDSLQSRIIDNYLAPRSIEISAENVTSNSDIATNPTNNNSINDSNHRAIHDHGFDSSPLERRLNTNINSTNSINDNVGVIGADNEGLVNNEQDISQRSTILLARIAMLYRQLESLETSMRQTSFTPFVNPLAAPECPELTASNNERITETNNGRDRRTLPENDLSADQSNVDVEQSTPITPSLGARLGQGEHASVGQTTTSTGNSQNPFEPLLFLFDECLMSLQLPPLTIDGQTVNLANVIEQYPVSVEHQLNYAMQLEIINQVNQNFIRISKLMSSARLYRRIVQQVMSSNSGSTAPHPNQRLNIQSVSSRSPRNTQNLPILLQNIQMGSLFGSGSLPTARTNNPMLALHFRNTATDVPLANICKIDLLAARTVCIMRAQLLVENALSNDRLTSSLGMQPSTSESASANSESGASSSGSANRSNTQSLSEFNQILNNLHSILKQINHAPLTTSNAYTHITSLRMTLERLLNALSAALHSSDPIRRSIHLIPSIAFNLTNRKRSMPLGATLDEIRLDVVHSLCFVDMTLHLVRQVQLLQMQRIPLLLRIEESRRSGNQASPESRQLRPTIINEPESDASRTENKISNDESSSKPTTSSASQSTNNKRKDSVDLKETKRRKLDPKLSPIEKPTGVEGGSSSNGSGLVEELDTEATARAFSSNINNISGSFSSATGRAADIANLLPDPSSEDDLMMRVSGRLFLWNNHPINRSLQRFVMTNPDPAVVNAPHISPINLVRFHQLYGDAIFPVQAVGWNREVQDTSGERASNAVHYETRRRALSQDNSTEVQDASLPITAAATSNLNASANAQRARIRAPAAFQLNLGPGGQNHHHHHHHHHHHLHQIPAGLVLDPWHRHPHLHIYQARGPGQHLWYNQWGAVPLPFNNSNYRIQCWNFSLASIPKIKDPQSNLIAPKCRIHNDSSVDVSMDGNLIACLVPHDELTSCLPSFDLKIFSLKSHDFGACYYKLPHGFNAVSVSLSPSANHAVVGLTSQRIIHSNADEDDVTIAKIYKLNAMSNHEFVRDVKIKRDDSASSLNAIRWMSRGIVYNVGPQHHQRYRMRNMMAP